AQLTTVLGPDQLQVFTQHLEQGLVDRHEHIVRFAIDREADANVHGLPAVSFAERRTDWLTVTEDEFENTESVGRRQGAPAVATHLQNPGPVHNGGGAVLHILAWLLGPPITIIVLFLILSSH